ncbi:hypothetical protein BJ170DRAFT_679303 [Xylariales sp. AK1849]|nr:hypothetical protein BJ170DRAFT_679303 [Xylariales sp. AK1849]
MSQIGMPIQETEFKVTAMPNVYTYDVSSKRWVLRPALASPQGRYPHRTEPTKALARRTSGIQRLPYEIISYIIQDLKLEEIYDLASCSRHFQFLIREESLCRLLLATKASYSLEAEEALQDGHHASGLRRLIKRRRAIIQASPYVAGIVGLADSYMFCCGKLCYIIEDRPNLKRWLRILDVQKATNEEIVVDIPALVAHAVPGSETCRKYTFKILHHAAGITSCLYSFARPRTQNWLIIFDALKHLLLGNIQLESANRIFVRNNQDHLFFGTHSEFGADGFRKWVLRHFDLQERQLSREKMHLSNVVGYEIGCTVCFEVIDNYFFGCSNQTAFEIEEIDWTSYYYCFQFSVNEFDPEKTRIMRKRDSWRRQHAEGPIDDRWGFLNLERDESTGSIKIIECRKEWLTGRSGNRRTYYTTPVVFHNEDGSEANEDDGASDNDPLPDDPMTSLLQSSNRPNYMVAPLRSPLQCHPGDDGSAMYGRNKTYLCSYYPSCDTFLDLVDHPAPSDPSTPRLRIRTGARVFDGLSETDLSQSTTHEGGMDTESGSEVSQHNVMSYWPPETGLADPTTLNSINRVLNLPGHIGHVTAAGDGRSIIYATGETAGSLKALVFLSFDPSVRLAGMIREGTLEGETMSNSLQGQIRIGAVSPKGKGKEVHHAARPDKDEQENPSSVPDPAPYVYSSPTEDLAIRLLPPPEEGHPWASIQKAFHHEFPWKHGFHYTLKVEAERAP